MTPSPIHPRIHRRSTPRLAASFSIVVALSMWALTATPADAKPTPVEKCRAGKNRAVGKYTACLQAAEAALLASGDDAKYGSVREKCRATFLKTWATAEAKAAKAGGDCTTPPLSVVAFDSAVDGQSLILKRALAGDGFVRCGDGVREQAEECDDADLDGATCATIPGFALGTLRCASGCLLDTSGCFATRFVDNGDGTVTDHETGLQWEQKTTVVGSGANGNDPHDVDNQSSWAATVGGTKQNGTAFTDFLGALNACTADAGGGGAAGGFAGHCDWRLPTVAELQTIVDPEAAGCGSSGPCIDPIFGPTVAFRYWSASTDADFDTSARGVNFLSGAEFVVPKDGAFAVRAVRTGE